MTSKIPLPEFDLARFTAYRLAVAAQQLSERLARVYQERFGITISEWRVLVHLAYEDNVSVRDIELPVALEKSKISRTVARLEGRGLVAKLRNEGDKRLVRLSLTDEGRSLMSELLPLAAAFQDEVMAELGDSAAGLEAGLDRLLGADDAETPATAR